MEQLNQNLYLAPEQLTANEANEKARPAEKPEDRAARVRMMAQSIAANGQELPVLIVQVEADDVVTYEYVDGGCRVEAIAALNEEKVNGDAGRPVWCSLVEPDADLFKLATSANIHRTQNSMLDMAHIVQEAFDRNDWKGKGGGKKVAEYLGIQESRVSEYQKLLHAPPDVKAKIESGEIATLEAALKLMSMPADKREEVGRRAAEIAQEEAEEAAERKGRKGNPTPKVPTFKPGKENKAKVKTKHVERAAKESGVETTSTPRAKSEISEFFEQVSAAAYPKAAVAFAEYFVGTWIKGDGSDRKARELFDAAVGVKAPRKTVKPPKTAGPKPKAPKKKK